MATIVHGGTISNGAMPADVYALIDNATVSNIVNADITDNTIANSKLVSITTAGKVSGAALTALASIPSASGVIPVANLGTGTPDGTKYLKDDGTFTTLAVATAATQADQEAATSVVTAVTPARQHFHASSAKAWCEFNGATSGTNAPTSGYNVTSVTKNSDGNYTITFTSGFSGTSYCVTGSGQLSGDNGVLSITVSSKATGSCVIKTYNSADAPTSGGIINIVCYGDM